MGDKNNNDHWSIIAQVFQIRTFLVDFFTKLNEEEKSKQNLADFYDEFCRKMGVEKNYCLINQGVYLTLLYGTLVYPKEAFLNDIPEDIDFNNNKWGNPDILEWPNEGKDSAKKLNVLIKRLRNSLSHANFEIKDGGFIFIDHTPNNPESNRMDVEFSIEGLDRFVCNLNKSLRNNNWE